jgi:hypothetical protein
MSNHKPTSESFLVQVRYHEHATLQGTIVWADENRTANFRSGMELLYLLDEAMATGGTGAPWAELNEPCAPKKKPGPDRER